MPGTDPSSDVLEQVRERCAGATRTLDAAVLRFEDEVKLQTGEQRTFKVTLAAEDHPAHAPTHGTVQGKLALACHVEARLVVTGDVIRAAPTGWQADQYLPPEPVRWSWAIDASRAGTAVGTVELKPVVRISDERGRVTAQDLRTEEYDVTFVVTRSGQDAAGQVWKQVAGAAGLVVTLLTGATLAYGLRRRREPSGDS